MNGKLTVQWTGNRNSHAFFKVNPGSNLSGMQRTAIFFQNHLSLFFLPKHWPVPVGIGVKAEHAAQSHYLDKLSPSQPALPRRQCLQLFLQPRARPTLASPGQGSAQVHATSQIRPAPGRVGPARPPVHRSLWTPASGAGRGPRRPPPRQLWLGRRVRPTRYTSPRPTCRGERGSWTAATGPRTGAQATGARPRDPRYPWCGRAERDVGGLPRASAARRGGRGDLALPSTPVHRRRRHFAFHSVSPPPHSAAGFPDVGISRRRLRGGRGLGASDRPAAGGQSAACGSRLPPVVLSSALLASVAPAWRWPGDSPRLVGSGSPPSSPPIWESVCLSFFFF